LELKTAKKKQIFLSPPHMSGEEMRFVKEAFDSNYIAPVGPMVDAFEREFAEYVGIKHCLALSSGTAAMHLALRCLPCKQDGAWSMEPGETPIVLASTLTFIGSVTPVVFEGATPVFIDCDRQTWNMDPDLLAQELAACERRGKMPKAEICDGYGVPVVCDSAESLGAKYHPQITQITQMVHAGVGAKAAIYSFNGNKIITTSGGGMLVNDKLKNVMG
jgi:dTDP-4-amino-4,6-dideoxygalactose transaminase